MRYIDTKLIEDLVYSLALKACVVLSPACKKAIEGAIDNESSISCKFALKTALENAEVAKEYLMPLCQDTGLAVVFISVGQEVVLQGKPLIAAVNEGVRRAYEDGRFRKSVCDPLTRVNTADNTPAVVHTEIVEGDKVEVTFMPKGFGSENMSKLYMLTPAQGVDGIINAVVDTVKAAGSRPCPPVVVGVGIGGTFDTCALLSKKALMRELGSQNERKDVAVIERTALEKINALRIGAQGFGGDVTALSVMCEVAPTHIAGLPVAVNIQCHCVRCEKGEI